MMVAGPFPDADDRREFRRMGEEKVAAFTESVGAMTGQLVKLNQQLAQQAMAQWWAAWMSPWAFLAVPPGPFFRFPFEGLQRPALSVGASLARVADKALAPVHRRATGNARRLRRIGKR